MYIKSVEITNYRIFYKNHYFNFNPDENKSLNVIFGKNSVGKSSLIDAIHWCLYGYELRKLGIEPICNDEIVEEVAVNEKIPVKVIVRFVNNLEQEIVVCRSVSVYKNENGKIIQGQDDIFEITYEGIPFFSPKSYISKRCNVDLFDLSYIHENEVLFNDDFEKKITSILGNYFQFDVIDKTYAHLNKSYNKFLKESKKIHSEIYIIDEYNKYVKEQEEISQEIDNLNNKLFKLKELQEAHYKKINSEDIEKREKLIKDLNHVDNDINKWEVDYSYLVLKSFPSAILINELCSNSERIKSLSNFLSEEKFDVEFHKYKHDLKHDLSNLKIEIFDIPEYIKKIHSLKETRLEIVNEINLIDNSLSNKDDKWVHEKDFIEKEIDFSIYKINTLKHKNNFIKKEIHTLDKRIKEIRGISADFQKKDAFYKKAIDNLKLMKEEFFKNILSNISDLMNNFFIHDFCMSYKFSKIIIHENFEFDIVKNSGKHIHFLDLSYGERYIFYLSFMFSLQEIIEEDIFLIIDTQFLNFDGNHWLNFLSLLKNNSNQCFLLFNESMYDGVAKSNLIDNINFEYELVN